LHVEAAANFLSPQQDPDRAPRPYDLNADGAVLSEGGATLIVEKGSFARSRGAKVRGRIISLATVNLPTRFYPVGDFSKNMEMALARLFSSTDTQALDLICGDGRGIPGMDRAEAIGIRRTLGKLSDKVPITSIQGSLGHAGGTSAMFQIIATAWALDSSLIPPIRNFEKPAPGCDLDFVFGKARKSRVSQALVLSHGWGGHHSALVLQKDN
jgi:3-oxoacyl-(acyl-carrier-protein) synthase